uniref:Uncharacterized protein n=1 Tax=Arundo donax TaxID=35708 RepID=A0A0A8Z9S9_ARUDO
MFLDLHISTAQICFGNMLQFVC